METRLEANRDTRQVIVTVDGQLVTMWDGFASAMGMVQFAESLVRCAVGVKGHHILRTVAALERAQDASEHPEWHPRSVGPVADLRGMKQVASDDLATVVWVRVDPVPPTV